MEKLYSTLNNCTVLGEIPNADIITRLTDALFGVLGIPIYVYLRINGTEYNIYAPQEPLTDSFHSSFCELLRQNPELYKECNESDKRIERESLSFAEPSPCDCWLGLKEFAVPLVNMNEYYGKIVFGQFLTDKGDRKQLENILRQISVKDPDYDTALLEEVFAQIKIINPQTLKGSVKLITLLRDQCISSIQLLKKKNRSDSPSGKSGSECIIGESPVIISLKHQLEKIARHDVPVLIRGESGTGKELAASVIHSLSGRSSSKLITQNCAAIPENLIESELFGHTKGAFTDAKSDRKGLFELADGGTLFLDEIGDMTSSLQLKLLRVLEDGVVKRVGGNTAIKVNVRLITATNQDIEKAITEGKFRSDFYYRINAAEIILHPLRERTNDIELLINHFIEYFRDLYKKPYAELSSEAMNVLLHYRWPGNVRELKNEINRLVSCADPGLVIEPSAISHRIIKAAPSAIPARSDQSQLYNNLPTLKDTIEIMERNEIVRALISTKGNKSKVAKILGCTRNTLYRRLEKYGLDKE